MQHLSHLLFCHWASSIHIRWPLSTITVIYDSLIICHKHISFGWMYCECVCVNIFKWNWNPFSASLNIQFTCYFLHQKCLCERDEKSIALLSTCLLKQFWEIYCRGKKEIKKRLLDLITCLLHASCSIMELAVCPTVKPIEFPDKSKSHKFVNSTQTFDILCIVSFYSTSKASLCKIFNLFKHLQTNKYFLDWHIDDIETIAKSFVFNSPSLIYRSISRSNCLYFMLGPERRDKLYNSPETFINAQNMWHGSRKKNQSWENTKWAKARTTPAQQFSANEMQKSWSSSIHRAIECRV